MKTTKSDGIPLPDKEPVVTVNTQSNLVRSFFTGLEDKNEQNGKNDASGIIVFSV